MRALFALLVVAGLGLAGCITPSDLAPASASVGDTVSAGYDAVKTLLAGLPCEATSVPAGATSDNLLDIATVAYDGSAHGEIDLRGDWLLAARFQAGGFEVVHIADPTNPTFATLYQAEEENAQDVKWMPDNRSAVVGVNRKVVLVDLAPVLDSDVPPAEMFDRDVVPTFVSAWEYPANPPSTGPASGLTVNMHMLTTARIAETDYVFVAPNDDNGVWVLKLTGEGDGRVLETVAIISPPVLGGGALGPHDMSLVWDELSNIPVLYVANGFEGWVAWDVSDPANAKMLALVPNLLVAQGYTHTILGQKVGERRLVITIAEVGSNVMSVFDATNWQAPLLLAQWVADKTKPHFPQHNIQLLNGTLYLAHYTQGVYVFDLNTLDSVPLAGTATLTPSAHYMTPTPTAPDTLGFGDIWDVVVHRGVLYMNDMEEGTHVVGFGCLVPGDSAATSYN